MKLTYAKTKTPDFSGFLFYVEAGSLFEVQDYAEAYGLDANEIGPQSIKAAQDEAGRLIDGEWLEVSHE